MFIEKDFCKIALNRRRSALMALLGMTINTGKNPASRQGKKLEPGRMISQSLIRFDKFWILHLILVLSMLVPASSYSKQTADPKAPDKHRPTILRTANGIPQVDIQTPNKQGVSHNIYSQFDVGKQGVILNNATDNVQTQLGGWIKGNPWLRKGANTILNEINAQDPSAINGFIEVAGQRADMIIANPAGIQVNGGGFINISRATLTTGRPIFDQNTLTAFHVQGGKISIAGQGLNATSTDYTGILARAIEVNAGVWAKNLQMISGNNLVNHETGKTNNTVEKVLPGKADKPAYAIDVSLLGGMYAGKIQLIGTEHGIAVNNKGVIAADIGNVTLTNDGQLINSGTLISHAEKAVIASEDLDNQGSIQAKNAIDIAVVNNAKNSGLISSSNHELRINAGNAIDNSQGKLNAPRLDIEALTLTNEQGNIEQTGSQALVITTQDLSNTNGLVGYAVEDSIEGTDGNNQGDSSGDNMAEESVAEFAAGQIKIKQSLNNDEGSIIASGQTNAQATQHFSNTQGDINVENLQVKGSTFANTEGSINATAITIDVDNGSNIEGTLYASEQLNITVAQTLNNIQGKLNTDAAQQFINADTLINKQGSIIHKGDQQLVITANSIEGSEGQLLSESFLDIDASEIGLDKAQTQAHKINIEADSLSHREASLVQTGAEVLTFNVTGEIDNTQGDIYNAADINITTGSLKNQSGDIQTNAALEINASGVANNQSGQLLADGTLQSDSASLDNHQGTITSGASQSISIRGHINNTAGSIQSISDLHISAEGVFTSTAGKVISNDNLTLDVKQLNNNKGTLASISANVDIDSAEGLSSQQGLIQAATDLTLNSQALDNDQGTIIAEQLTVNTHEQDLTNTKGQIFGTDVNVQSGALNNSEGLISGTTQVVINTFGQRFNNSNTQSSGIESSGAGSSDIESNDTKTSQGVISTGILTLTSGELTNTNGYIGSKGNSTINATAADNIEGQLQTGKENLSVASIDNNRGEIGVEGDAVITSSGDINSIAGSVIANGILNLTSQALDNTHGTISGTVVDINTNQQALTSTDGIIHSNSTLSINSGTLNNDSGLVQSIKNLFISTHEQELSNQNANDSEGIISQSALDIKAGDINSSKGFIGSKQNLTITAEAIKNQNGAIETEQQLHITAKSVNNRQGSIQSEDKMDLDLSTTLTNDAGLVRASKTLDVQATTINNSNSNSNTNSDQGLQANNIVLEADSVNNRQSTIIANKNINITAGVAVDNTQGTLNAGQNIVVKDRNATKNLHVTNSNGTFIAGNDLTIDSQSVTGDGALLAINNIDIDIDKDFNLKSNGELIANGSIDVTTQSGLTNNGKVNAKYSITLDAERDLINQSDIIADHVVKLSANNINNRQGKKVVADTMQINARQSVNNAGRLEGKKSIEVIAGTVNNTSTGKLLSNIRNGKTIVKANNALVNTGLINGADTIIKANTVKNTEKIYGTDIAIQANQLINGKDRTAALSNINGGNSSAGVIAARHDLHLAGKTLLNEEGALIYARGDLYIGGALNTHNKATGNARSLTNASATIDIQGDADINARQINNENRHFVLGSETINNGIISVIGPTGKKEYDLNEIRFWEVDDHRVMRGITYRDINEKHIDHLPLPSWKGKEGLRSRWGIQLPSRTRLTGFYPSQSYERKWFNEKEVKTVVKSSDPGSIRIRGNLNFSNNLKNIDSQILIGQNLISGSGNQAQNLSKKGQSIKIRTHGKRIEYTMLRDSNGQGTSHTENRYNGKEVCKEERSGCESSQGVTYNPAPIISTFSLETATIKTHTQAVDSHSIANTPSSHLNTKSVASKANNIYADANATVRGQGQATVDTSIKAADPDRQSIGFENISVSGEGQQIRQTILTSNPNTALPTAALFEVNPDADLGYIIETDTQFTGHDKWLNSDYLLQALSLNPATTLNRLGDGFYEQQLIKDQIANLTGHRFLQDYSNDQQQYAALMDNAATFADQYKVRPGVTLSKAQMAQLTSDIVWLVEKNIDLENGQVVKALVPQVYVAVKDGDLKPSGALISANNIDLNLTGNVTNQGTIAGRHIVKINADTVDNLSGRLTGELVNVDAAQDINNIGGAIVADKQLALSAGRDINIETTTQSSQNNMGSNQTLDRLAGLYINNPGGSNLLVNAGRNLNLIAAEIKNKATDGHSILTAGSDINLKTINTHIDEKVIADRYNKTHRIQAQEIATDIDLANNVQLQAGRDISIRGAAINSDTGDVNALAGRDISIESSESREMVDHHYQYKHKSGLFSKTTVTGRNHSDSTTANATTLSGANVNLQAQQNIKIKGSNVIADNDLSIAGIEGQVTIEQTTEQHQNNSYRHKKKSGLMSGGGLGFTLGTRETKQTSNQQASNQSATGSRIGALDGNLSINAGKALNITGSDLLAGKDIQLRGERVTIEPGADQGSSYDKTETKQTGLTLSVSNAVLDTAQTVNRMQQIKQQSDNTRVKAFADATAVLAATNLKDDLTKSDGEFDVDKAKDTKLSIAYGSSKSSSENSSQYSNAATSDITAENNITIIATGGGDNSDINIKGARLGAGNNINLNADDSISLQSAQNTHAQQSNNSSSSSTMGVSMGGGNVVSIDLAGSQGRGQGDGSSVTQQDSVLEAGNQVNISSGGDTQLHGAQVKGKQIVAAIGGDLSIQSSVDSANYASDQKSAGFNASIGIGGPSSISVNTSKQTIDHSYQSTNKQSGLYAGEDGFEVNVAGNTHLQGGVIASDAEADNNRLSTQSLGHENIDNHLDIHATTAQASAGVGDKAQTPLIQSDTVANTHQKSTTQSAIAQGHIVVRDDNRTGNNSLAGLSRDTDTASGALSNSFDLTAVQEKQQQAQLAQEVAQSFSQQAMTAVGNHYQKQADKLELELKLEQDKAPDNIDQSRIDQLTSQIKAIEKNRTTAHSVVGDLTAMVTGGSAVEGALGAKAGHKASNQVAEAVAEKVNKGTLSKQTGALITNLSATAAGAVAGGRQGAFAANQGDRYNRQLHPSEIDLIKQHAETFAEEQGLCNDKGCSDENIETAESRLSHKLLSYLDSDWNGTLTTLDPAEDDAALDFLARNLTSIGDLYTIYPDSELPTIGPEPKRTYTADQIKQALKNYSVNHSDSYNDALENADHLRYLGRGLDLPATSSADFYKERVALPPKNAQLEATTGTIAGVMDEGGQLVSGIADLADGLLNDTANTLENVVEATHSIGSQLVFAPDQIAEEVNDLITDRKQRAALARLQGDEFTASRIEAETKAEIVAILAPAAKATKVLKTADGTHLPSGSKVGDNGADPEANPPKSSTVVSDGSSKNPSGSTADSANLARNQFYPDSAEAPKKDAFVQNSGLSSTLVPGGGLKNHEAVTSVFNQSTHTIMQHVGLSQANLAKRLNGSKLKTTSTFASRADAERLISKALDIEKNKINDFLAKPKSTLPKDNRLVLNVPLNTNTGSILNKGADSVVSGSGIRIVIDRVPNKSGLPYTIVTAFPTK